MRPKLRSAAEPAPNRMFRAMQKALFSRENSAFCMARNILFGAGSAALRSFGRISRPRFRGRRCGWRFLLGRGRLVLRGSGVRSVYVNVMLGDLLLERDNIRKIRHGCSCQCALHEFEPNGKCRPRPGFSFAE